MVHHGAPVAPTQEFVSLVTNYTMLPEYEERRRAIVRRAQALALRKFTWAHVATRVTVALREAMGALPTASSATCPADAAR